MELIFKYKRSTIVWLLIIAIVLLCPAVILLVLSFKSIGYLYAALVYAAVVAIYFVKMAGELKKRNYALVISPDGVKYEDGKMIPSKDIDYCYIHIRRETGSSSGLTGILMGGGPSNDYRLVVVKSDGKKEFIDLTPYGLGEKDALSLHAKLNATDGMPWFSAPVVEN